MKGYADKRYAEWKKSGAVHVGMTGQANVSGWQQLAALAERSGIPVQHGGELLVAAA